MTLSAFSIICSYCISTTMKGSLRLRSNKTSSSSDYKFTRLIQRTQEISYKPFVQFVTRHIVAEILTQEATRNVAVRNANWSTACKWWSRTQSLSLTKTSTKCYFIHSKRGMGRGSSTWSLAICGTRITLQSLRKFSSISKLCFGSMLLSRRCWKGKTSFTLFGTLRLGIASELHLRFSKI